MAEVHVRVIHGRRLRLVCHVPAPAGNNSASVPWATALKNSGIAGTTELPDGDGTAGTIDATEKTSIVNGDVYERAVPYDTGADWDGLSASAKNARIDAIYAAVLAETQTSLQARLKYFGYTREVP